MSSPSPSLPVGLNLGTTYGAYLIGAIAAAILYGIIVLQLFFYFDRYPKDKFGIKALVVTLFLLDTLTVIMETHGTVGRIHSQVERVNCIGLSV
ncbi:hypothetical protein DFH09DRAFT_272688 [Mycena vulgaris]|nr:hypothetical protein DFH09DRAFT_272688 [Mycena vulgaris]